MRISLGFCLALSTAFAPAPALAFEAAQPFVASRDPAAFERALQCLTEAVYYEARSESDDGQRAVAQVVLNRVRHPAYPSSVCGVVYQGSHRTTGCQFTFTCDGSLGGWIEPYAWDRARRIAEAALRGNVYRPVGLALNYHTTAIRPYWAPSLIPQITVGAHIFYRRPGSGSADAFSQAPSDYEPEAMAQPRYAAARSTLRRTVRPTRERYAEVPVLEIPVVERPVLARTLGGRRASASSAARPQPTRTAAVRVAAPRVAYQGGIRVVRGGGGAAN
jgi:hypothetical protein